jgi:hypothetical protein
MVGNVADEIDDSAIGPFVVQPVVPGEGVRSTTPVRGHALAKVAQHPDLGDVLGELDVDP